jgi:hypothetical protein
MFTSSTTEAMLSALERLSDPDAADGPDLRAAFDAATTGDSADGWLATTPSTVRASVARVCLLTAAGRDEEVLALTHGVAEQDDLSAVLLCCRGAALTRVGLVGDGAETLQRVAASRSRHREVRALARHLRTSVEPPTRRRADT